MIFSYGYMKRIFLYLLSEMHVRVYHHSIIGAASWFSFAATGFLYSIQRYIVSFNSRRVSPRVSSIFSFQHSNEIQLDYIAHGDTP
jgi:hypothetical protein